MSEGLGERHLIPGMQPGDFFSFVYDDEPGQSMLGSWETSEESRTTGAELMERFVVSVRERRGSALVRYGVVG